MKRGNNSTARNCGLHVSGNAATWRNQRLKLVTYTHQRVGHADDNLARKELFVLLGSGCS